MRCVCLVELRGFEPLTPCMPWPCGHLAAPYVTTSPTELPQVDGTIRRGDTLAREASRGIVSGKSLASLPCAARSYRPTRGAVHRPGTQ
jgi:hypothetical protein